MVLDEVFGLFVKATPISVMLRALLEYALPDSAMDELFRRHAHRQREDELLFSSVVDLLGLTVCGSRKSVNAAYGAARERFQVSVTSVYNKLKGTEPAVSQALVRHCARRLGEVLEILEPQPAALLPGYRVLVLDGNHLAATEHRLKETRRTNSAPLPGQCLVVLDPHRMLVTDVFPCTDAHAQERSLLGEVLPSVQAGQLWLADRNFCTSQFVLGVIDRGAHFLVRQHRSTLSSKRLLDQRRLAGRSSTGKVYEQSLQIDQPRTARSEVLRRITVELDQPTREGETEIQLICNLPGEVDAVALAELYLQRWTVEHAFQQLEQSLRSEIDTLCYPQAALLGFCIGLYTHNVISMLKQVLHVVHGDQAARDRLSSYYLAEEVRATYGGLVAVIPPQRWAQAIGGLTAKQMAELLRELAGHIRVEQFLKRGRGPKKPQPKRSSGKKHHHVSTARLLQQRNNN